MWHFLLKPSFISIFCRKLNFYLCLLDFKLLFFLCFSAFCEFECPLYKNTSVLTFIIGLVVHDVINLLYYERWTNKRKYFYVYLLLEYLFHFGLKEVIIHKIKVFFLPTSNKFAIQNNPLMQWRLIFHNTVNPFVPNAPFPYPLKTLENLTVFWCFQGVEKGCIGNEWFDKSKLEVWKLQSHRLRSFSAVKKTVTGVEMGRG